LDIATSVVQAGQEAESDTELKICSQATKVFVPDMKSSFLKSPIQKAMAEYFNDESIIDIANVDTFASPNIEFESEIEVSLPKHEPSEANEDEQVVKTDDIELSVSCSVKNEDDKEYNCIIQDPGVDI